MKALVVEIKGKYAVVLNKDGTFTRIKNCGDLRIGCETEIPSGRVVMFPGITKLASTAAAFFLFIGLGYGVYCYNTPYSYVSVDINPGIEITANRFDKILKASAINEDGKAVLKGISLKHKSLADGLESIVEAAIDEGYLKTETDNAMIITVSSDDAKKADELETKVQKAAADELKISGLTGEVLVEGTSKAKQTEAKKIGVTPGKLNLIKRLEAVKEDINIDEYKDASVKQLLNEIKDASELAENKEKEKGIGKEAAVEQPEPSTTEKAGTIEKTTESEKTGNGKTSPGKSGKDGTKKDNGKKPKAAPAANDKGKDIVSGNTAQETSTVNATIDEKKEKNKQKEKSWIEKKVEDLLNSVGITQQDDKNDKWNEGKDKGNNSSKGNEKGKK